MLPGGVNSPVRAFKSVGGQPIIFESVKGCKCYDVDGNEYIDYVGSWGPAIVGHANDEVNAALKAQVDKGTSFGAPCELEVLLYVHDISFALYSCVVDCQHPWQNASCLAAQAGSLICSTVRPQKASRSFCCI